MTHLGCGLAVITVMAGQLSAQNTARKFYPDDPLLQEPAPHAVKHVQKLEIDELYDFLYNSFATPRRERSFREAPRPALDVNTLGDVPNSPWYTNRHFYKRMSMEELKRGPGNSTPPSPIGSWRVVSAKSNGVMPGFVIEDKNKNRYLLKLDPPEEPELASATDVIGSKFFYALGYNTPENYVVHFTTEKLEISPGVMWRDETGRKSPLTARALDQLLRPQPKSADGTYRAMASRWVPGNVIGPFSYDGTRSDDPNDIVAHEDRRELRGLRVFASWLNHTDTKSINTLDTLVTENGIQYIRHYLIDFGSILGSAGTDAKQPWYGHEYLIDPKGAGLQMVTFGFYNPIWVRSDYPNIKGVGLFDFKSFDPVSWKGDYPNPAFLLMDNADAYWAAKQVAAFTDADIRALVETGEYSDPRATDWITECLIKRRDKIAQEWLSRVLPLDHFSVVNGELTFENVGAKYGLGDGREYKISWSSIDDRGESTRLMDVGARVPKLRGYTKYLAANIGCPETGSGCASAITVYLRGGEAGVRVIGIDR